MPQHNKNTPDTVQRRPYIGIHFKCCNVYTRVYLNRDGTAYLGHCPRCTARITVNVSPTGKRSRFWTAG